MHDHVDEIVAEGFELAQPAQAFLQLEFLLTELEVCPDAGIDLLELKGFADVIHAAGLEGADFVFGFTECADEEDWDIAPAFIRFQPPADFIAVHFGHADVPPRGAP